MKWFRPLLLLFFVISLITIFSIKKLFIASEPATKALLRKDTVLNPWIAPDINTVPATEEGSLILYGRELIRNTAEYFGPKGTVAAAITNGMNCQNCHIDAGAKPYGNSFAAVAANYPQYRSRSGIIESIEFRINDCIQRSLNGKVIDSLGKEMRAMVAYLKWIGKNVPSKTKPEGAGVIQLSYLQRAADTAKGRIVFMNNCILCHGVNGEGSFNKDSSGFTYPPLWGNKSYNTGAGLFRISRFAGYVKYNMPFGKASYDTTVLTDEEAWDVAAFVNSQPRPEKVFKQDWPDINQKATDYPYGPFADTFSVIQHKYGPFEPIDKFKKDRAKK